MRGIAVGWSWTWVLMGASVVGAAEDGPRPPAAGSAAEVPAPAELPPGLEAQPLPGSGPVLAVPGVGSPGTSAGRSSTRLPAPGVSSGGFDLPPLVGPAEGLGPASVPAVGSPPTSPGWAGSPSIPGATDPEAIPPGMRPQGLPDPIPDPTMGLDRTRRGPGSGFGEAPRRTRLFGRWQPLWPMRPRNSSLPDDTIAVEPRSDPASDAALKRRLESQIRTAVGSRLRSLDVKVVDRDVTITARVTRFWYRRSVKHSIESIASVSGYKTYVDVGD